MPALFTQVSKPPKESSAVCTMRCTSSIRATSAWTQTASPPAPRIRWTTSRSASSLRAARTTRAPRRAASRPVARPMPLEAPVITTTCSPMGFNLSAMSLPPLNLHAGSRGAEAAASDGPPPAWRGGPGRGGDDPVAGLSEVRLSGREIAKLDEAGGVGMGVREPQPLLRLAGWKERDPRAEQHGKHEDDVFGDEARGAKGSDQLAAADEPGAADAAGGELGDDLAWLLAGDGHVRVWSRKVAPREEPARLARVWPGFPDRFEGAASDQQRIDRRVEGRIAVVLARDVDRVEP